MNAGSRSLDRLPRAASPLARSLSRRRLVQSGAGLVVAAALPLLTACGEAVGPLPAATVAPFPGNGEPPRLVDAGWLAARLEGPDRPLVVDLSPPRVYRAGHVPGAIHGWWQDTIDPHDPTYGVVLKNRAAPFSHAHVLASLGIGDETQVVFYDDDRNRYAARLVWYLAYVGHQRAALLDGGLAAWRGASGEIDRDEHAPPAAPPATPTGRRSFIIETAELAARLTDPTLRILDTRTDEECADDLNGTIRRGQIPGALRLPWTATLRDEAGRLKSPDELTRLLSDAGLTPVHEIAIVARFGVETGQPWLALTLLGYPSIRVYDQAWAAWAAADDLPVVPLTPALVPAGGNATT